MSHPLIRYADEHLVVAAKPPGLAARAAAAGEQDGLADLLRRDPRAQLVNSTLRVVWAPDPADSGLCVMARTDAAVADLLRAESGGRVGHKMTEASLEHVARPSGFALPRRWRHAAGLDLHHPRSGDRFGIVEPPPESFSAALAGETDGARLAVLRARERRRGLFDPALTDAYRLMNGASDGVDDHVVDALAGALLIGHRGPLSRPLVDALAALERPRAIYARQLRRDVRQTKSGDATPVLVHGEPLPERFPIKEGGLTYLASMREGYSFGLFLDQRETRAWLRAAIKPGSEVLNVFAYTCAFSLCAAAAGARATSLDLSRRYLDWGRANFEASGHAAGAHDWIFGDAFDWLKRLARKGRRFGTVILDPPTFSTAKTSGAFSAEQDYGRLAGLALALVAPGGRLVASTNAARLAPARFAADLDLACRTAGRSPGSVRLATQPVDFPASPGEPAYLKIWSAVV